MFFLNKSNTFQLLILARRLKKYRNVLTWQNTPKWWTAGHAEIAIAYASTSTNETTPQHSTNLTIATVSTLNFQSELSLINGRIQLKNRFISAIMNTESHFRHSRTSQTVTSISPPNLGLSDQSSRKLSLSGHVHAHSSKNLIIVTVSDCSWEFYHSHNAILREKLQNSSLISRFNSIFCTQW